MDRINRIWVMSECDVLDIHGIMQGLAEKRPVFHSEADFKHALARQIRETIPGSEIQLEWKPIEDENLHVDVWIPSHGIVIELKYPATEPLEFDHRGERYVMKKYYPVQSRYDFIKDISRVEKVVFGRIDVRAGLAILLTNHPNLWKNPTTPAWQDTDDAAFRLHEGRELRGTLQWSPGSSHLNTKLRKNPIPLRGTYPVHWHKYKELDVTGRSLFCYLAVQVGK